MIKGYETKEMQPTTMEKPKKTTMKNPAYSQDGEIHQEGTVWIFSWKGNERGYATKEEAERKLSLLNGDS